MIWWYPVDHQAHRNAFFAGLELSGSKAAELELMVGLLTQPSLKLVSWRLAKKDLLNQNEAVTLLDGCLPKLECARIELRDRLDDTHHDSFFDRETALKVMDLASRFAANKPTEKSGKKQTGPNQASELLPDLRQVLNDQDRVPWPHWHRIDSTDARDGPTGPPVDLEVLRCIVRELMPWEPTKFGPEWVKATLHGDVPPPIRPPEDGSPCEQYLHALAMLGAALRADGASIPKGLFKPLAEGLVALRPKAPKDRPSARVAITTRVKEILDQHVRDLTDYQRSALAGAVGRFAQVEADGTPTQIADRLRKRAQRKKKGKNPQ